MADLRTLEISKRALLAQKFGLDVTSNNIANLNSTNYSRRQAVLSETNPIINQNGFWGTGVIAEKLRTFRNEFFDSEIRKTISQSQYYETDNKYIERAEAILAEPSDYGLGNVVADFFNAFENVSLNPESIAQRENLLSVAQTMVDRFHLLAQQIQDIRREALQDLNSNIIKANKLIKNIAELNKQIANSKAQSGSEAQSYVDERAGELEELSKLFGIVVTNEDNGTINVFINGINIITDSTYSQLKISETTNPVTGEVTASIAKIDEYSTTTNNISVQSGEIASLLKHYNVTFDDKDSSGGFSLARKLNDFANAIVQKVNTLAITGYGLNDEGDTPPTRYFFEPTIGNATAFTIQISDSIKNSPENIPLSDKAGEPGNNNIARAIARIATDSTFLEGQTPAEFYSNIVGKLGSIGNEANTGKNTTRLIYEQLTSQRESVIGVNLDEEAVNLIKFQRAFEASSRVVTVTNELLGTLINLGK